MSSIPTDQPDAPQPLTSTDSPDTPLYNTKAVVRRTGVPADTVRAWERRYGVPRPQRTEKGQRLYSEREVGEIAWLREQTDRGLSIRQAVAMLKGGRSGLPLSAANGAAATPPPEGGGAAYGEAAGRLFEAIAAYDAQGAERVCSECLAAFGVEATCLRVIQPMMYRIGEEWAAGALPIAVEHFASHVVRTQLSNLGRAQAGTPATLGPVLTACAPGEQHEVGLVMLGLFLMRRDVRVIHLGPDLPLDELSRAVRRVRPAMICLSATTVENARVLLRCLEELEETGVALPPLSCGGYAFQAHPELRARTETLSLGGEAVQAADAIRSLLSAPRH